MPTYDYACTLCDRVFEVFHSIKDKPVKVVKTECEQCQNKAPVQRLIGTGGAVIFKGSGFYETDYRSESYKKGEKAEKDSAKGADSGKSGDATKADKTTVDESGKKAKAPKVKESGTAKTGKDE